MGKDYAFPQLPVSRPTVQVVRPAPVELSPRLLGDLAHLCRIESSRARSIDDYTHLNWIAADLDRRWRKAVDKR